MKLRRRFGNITILAVLDWGVSSDSPPVIFSQKLSSDEQIKFLERASKELSKLGVTLVYPIHGGFVGSEASKLAYGKYRFYDAQAPKYRTYLGILKIINESLS